MSKTDFMDDQRHILVIGGAGYIGNVLVDKLLEDNYRVTVLDKLIYKNGESIVNFIDNPNFSFVYGDFRHLELIKSEIKDVTDVVLLASLVGDPICKKYPELAKDINETATIKLINNLNNRGIDRYIFTSTCSNYGLREDDKPATEESELNPKSLYAETKIAVENYLIENVEMFDFAPIILRISTAFGLSRRMRFDLTVSEFTRELTIGNELLVYDENTWRPYCHVRDISEAIVGVLQSSAEKVRGKVYNVGSDENNLTKKMIVDLITDELGEGKVKYKIGGFDPRNYRVSFSKIYRELGFNADYNIKDSIKKLIYLIKRGLFSDFESRKNFYGNYEIENQ